MEYTRLLVLLQLHLPYFRTGKRRFSAADGFFMEILHFSAEKKPHLFYFMPEVILINIIQAVSLPETVFR